MLAGPVVPRTVRLESRLYAVYPHDVAFHRAVSAAAHNSFYLEVIDMSSQLFQGAMQAADRAPGDVLKAAEEHAMIAHHVLLGDAGAARRAMRAHILAGNERRLMGSKREGE